MTVIRVPDMSCDHCVARINKTLGEENLKFKVSLDNKTVEVDGDDAAVDKAIAALDDAGFEPVRAYAH